MSVNRVDRFSANSSPRRDDHAFPRRRETAPDPTPATARQRGRPPSEPLAPGAGRPLPIEIAFLAAHGVPLVLLQYGAARARLQGATADAVLIAERLVSEDVFYQALAAELNVAYVDAPHDLEPSADIAADAARGYARLPRNSRGLNWLFAPRGAEIGRLVGVTRSARGRPLFALTAPSLFEEALRRASAAQLARYAAHAVERVDPDCCVRPALRREALAKALFVSIILSMALLSPLEEISRPAAIALAIVFLLGILLRIFASFASFRKTGTAPELDDKDLPVYSIVVALYKEAAVARQLSDAIERLDYPRAKLDVKFIVECDDAETAEALRTGRTRAFHDIIVAPRGAPRTKPRALNVAMPFLRGSLAVVFDAEDLPEPDQLRKAAAGFAQAPQNVACLQASLGIHNGGHNWMTSMFAIDYANLFRVFNKGLAAMSLPFFLGGSSNHFRVESLRAVGGWDAFNVTEDADLGLRLARRSYETQTLASRTLEEAPSEFRALLRQRTRWFKGWMQTALVHCRDPSRFFADLGAARGIAVLAIFAGGIVGPLVGPFASCALFYQAAFGKLLTPATAGEAALSSLWCSVAILGFCAALPPKLVAMRREKLFALWPALLLSPLWTLMLMLAAWRAARDLWLRPFHWEKTEHGLFEPPLAVVSQCQANSHCLSEKPELSALR